MAKLYAIVSYTGVPPNVVAHSELYARDSDGNATQLSSHASPHRVEPLAETSFDDPQTELPWSIHHGNSFIGKGTIVDMAKLVNWAEKKMQRRQPLDSWMNHQHAHCG